MKIYILKIYDIKPKTKEMLEKELKIHNIKYEQDLTMDKYMKLVEDWEPGSTKFIGLSGGEPNAYFYDLNEAIYAAEHNLGDVNECGSYNYITITGVESGLMYGEFEPVEFYVYKYNDNDGYNEIVDKDDEIYKYLIKHNSASHITNQNSSIKLNLTKEEETSTKEFISSLKENFDKKDYGKVKQLIDTKEEIVSKKLDGFFDEVTNSFQQVDNSINKFLDIFNGK